MSEEVKLPPIKYSIIYKLESFGRMDILAQSRDDAITIFKNEYYLREFEDEDAKQKILLKHCEVSRVTNVMGATRNMKKK